MIRTIFWKDLRDAIRDARVLVAIVVPIGLGLFYNVSIGDDDPTVPRATIAIFTSEPTRLPALLVDVGEGVAELTFREVASAAEVERLIAADEASIGLILPAGFDAAVRQGDEPVVRVALPDDPSFGANYVLAALDPALRELAGQRATAIIETTTARPEPDEIDIFSEVGFRSYSILASVIFLVVMVCMLALPVILAEEAEKKTLDALVMIASYADVVAGKALVGLVYSGLSVAIMLGLTRLSPAQPLLFGAVLFLLALALSGFGLFVGGLFRSANQLNTWSGLLLMPFLAPVFFVGLPVPDWAKLLINLFPTSHGMRLAIDALRGEAIFGHPWRSFAVIAAWGVAAFGLLVVQLQRRQA